MKTGAWVIVFCCFLAASIGAEAVSVSYVEGNAFLRRGAAWTPLSAGDTVAANATLRLGEAAHVELDARGVRVVLSRAGTYSLRQILPARRAMDAAGVGASLQAALVHMLRGPSLKRSAAMGVMGSNVPSDEERAASAARRAERMRQAEQGEAREGARQGEQEAPAAAAPPPQIGSDLENGQETGTGSSDAQGADEESSYLASGKALIATQQYERAVDQLMEALGVASEQEMPEVRYYLAYARSMTGDTQAALALTENLRPAGDEEWAPDLAILRAKLLVDASAFAQEVPWLEQHARMLSRDPERAPVYYFLLALGYGGMGDRTREKENLSKVVSLGDTDLGKAAARLLAIRQAGTPGTPAGRSPALPRCP